MKCDICGEEVATLIGGYGKKICDWCYTVEQFNNEENEKPGISENLLVLSAVSVIWFLLGVAIGKYLL